MTARSDLIEVMAREPVATLEELACLEMDEVLEGYQDGYLGEREPGDNRSKAYWHGWRNGRVDGGYAQLDDAQRALASLVAKHGRAA